MKAAGCSEAAIAAFKQNYDQLVAGVTGLVSAAAIDSWFAVLLQYGIQFMCSRCTITCSTSRWNRLAVQHSIWRAFRCQCWQGTQQSMAHAGQPVSKQQGV
jgi:hypothetical protein